MVTPIPRRWFPQKILPLTYDNSLSYYEFLCKILAKINELIEDTTNKEMYDNIKDNIAEEYSSEKSYVVNDYVWHNETLYKCKNATTGNFDESKWERYRVADYLIFLLQKISELNNKEFWKVINFMIPQYSAGNCERFELAYQKVNDTTIKIGICMKSGYTEEFESNDYWNVDTVNINDNGALLNTITNFIRINEERTESNFGKIVSFLNTIAVNYHDEVPRIFKKYELCYVVPNETHSFTEWFNHKTLVIDNIPLYYAKRNTNNSIEFSEDNWQRIENTGVTFTDWIKAMIDEYGGGQPTTITARQNLRNEVISDTV